jgi:HK97 family phage major capsid protein
VLTIVENSLVKDFAVALDSQFINGTGAANQMLGLLNQVGVTAGAATDTNGGSFSGTTGFGFLADTLAAYEAANNDPDKAAWIIHSRT